MSVAKLSWLRSGVSSSWAAASGPSTTVIGVFGWTTRPSGTALTARPSKPAEANQVQKSLAEQSLAAARPVAAQRLDVDRRRLGRRDPLDERRQPGRHAVARLMVAVVGVRAEEVLEVHGPLVQPEPEVQLGHRQLVGVGAQDAVAEPGWRHTSKATSVA